MERKNFDRLSIWLGMGDKECIHNSSEDVSWRTALRRPRSKWDGNIKVYFKEISVTRLSLYGSNCVWWGSGQWPHCVVGALRCRVLLRKCNLGQSLRS